jgi:demethylspheroidene O-methyltransferase
VDALRDAILDARNRLYASRRFQRWAARFPLTRPIARIRAAALFDLCAGFVYSQVLQAAVQLGLFEALRDGPRTCDELSAQLSLRAPAMQRLADAAVSLRLLDRRSDGRYALGAHGAAFLANPEIAVMVEHHSLLYRDLSDPLALLRGERPDTELRRFWSYAGAATSASTPSDLATDVAAYSRLMSRSISLLADDILEAYSFRDHRCLLDVGGGEGAFVEAVAASAPHLSLMLVDLPPVAGRAQARFEAAGLADRARALGGNAISAPLPTGADVVSLVRVIHDHDDEAAAAMLRAVRRALPPRGVLLLAEPMADTPGAEAMGDAYFGFYLLAMGQGRPRSAHALRTLLLEAGFDSVEARRLRRPMLAGLLIARVK